MGSFNQRHLLDVGKILTDLIQHLDTFVEELAEYPEPIQERLKPTITKTTAMLQAKSDILLNTILDSDLKVFDLNRPEREEEEERPQNPSSPAANRGSKQNSRRYLPKLNGDNREQKPRMKDFPQDFPPSNIMMDLSLRSPEVHREAEEKTGEKDVSLHEVNVELSGDKRLAQSMKDIKKYKQMQKEFQVFRFLARNGVIDRDSQEFQKFKEHYDHLWTDINVSLRRLEQLLQQYAIPTAHVKGEELARKVSSMQAAGLKETLLECLVNRDQVETLMLIPGRRFVTRTEAAVREAAILIQGSARRFLAIQQASRRSKEKFAAPKLQGFWKVCKERMTRRNRLLKRRAEQEETWRDLKANLKQNWKRFLTGPRVRCICI